MYARAFALFALAAFAFAEESSHSSETTKSPATTSTGSSKSDSAASKSYSICSVLSQYKYDFSSALQNIITTKSPDGDIWSTISAANTTLCKSILATGNSTASKAGAAPTQVAFGMAGIAGIAAVLALWVWFDNMTIYIKKKKEK